MKVTLAVLAILLGSQAMAFGASSACEGKDPAVRYAISSLAIIYGAQNSDRLRGKMCRSLESSEVVSADAGETTVSLSFPKTSFSVRLKAIDGKFQFLAETHSLR